MVAGHPFLKVMNLAFFHIYDVPICMFFFLLFMSPFGAEAGRPALVRNFSSHSYSVYIVHHPIFSYVGVMRSTVVHTLGNFTFLAILLLPLLIVSRDSRPGFGIGPDDAPEQKGTHCILITSD